jgi:hypothetical protein
MEPNSLTAELKEQLEVQTREPRAKFGRESHPHNDVRHQPEFPW